MSESRGVAFPGQGGNWTATLQRLTEHSDHPLVVALSDLLGTDAWSELDGSDTRNVQPATYVAGLVPGTEVAAGLAVGHSLGGITAAAWAGAITPLDGLELLRLRAELGRRLDDVRPGAMVAVNRWSADRVELLRRMAQATSGGVLDLAVRNSPTQVVLAGDRSAVESAHDQANAEGAVARLLPISGAYHSSLLVPALAEFGDAVRQAVSDDPRTPVVSSTSQQTLRTAEELVDDLTRALVAPVDWPATMNEVRSQGFSTLVDAGPGDTLSRLARFVPDVTMTTR